MMFLRSPYAPPAALLASALLNIAMFPDLDQSWAAYLAFLPLFLLVPGRTPGKLFLYFFAAAFLFRVGNLYWIYHVIQHYSNLPPAVAVGVLLVLCATMACLWGCCGFLIGRCAIRSDFERAMFLAPFVWIVFEWGLNLLQFPWCLSGYSQYANLRIAQVSTVFGVYGLSWIVVAVNASLATAIVLKRYYYAAVVAFVMIVAAVFGQIRLARPLSGPTLTVACVQGNIPQDVKIDYVFADEVNRKHLEMTRELLSGTRPDIIFWSESSTLYSLPTGGIWAEQVYNLVRESGVPLMLGSDSFRGEDIYNSAFLIHPDGRTDGPYSKIYLVPFGEYVPLKRLFFFAGKVVPEISDFSPGDEYTLFSLDGGRFGVHICFEVVFPQLTREFCRRDASLLVTLTNDAWFGRSAAPSQHWAMASLRAIESRRYLVRAANTGISGIVDPYGRILNKTDIFVDAKFSGQVQWLNETTFYTRHGDVLVYASILVCVVIIVGRKKRSASPGSKSTNP